jgi:hypothetical protein
MNRVMEYSQLGFVLDGLARRIPVLAPYAFAPEDPKLASIPE